MQLWPPSRPSAQSSLLTGVLLGSSVASITSHQLLFLVVTLLRCRGQSA
uniref:Uncharacterized protein n=1 Tax=Rhizophora mucronata TaxID=61149 RepID=A0A2P2IXW0_RHIMU